VKASLFEVNVCRQRFPNAFPLHHDERQAIRQAPAFVGAGGEQVDGVSTQFSTVRDHFNSRIVANSFKPKRYGSTGSGARHCIKPLPANGLGCNDEGSGLYQIALPGEGVRMILVAGAEQRDPKSGVGEKGRRQNQSRFGVP
jgi:hypothetical protein